MDKTIQTLIKFTTDAFKKALNMLSAYDKAGFFKKNFIIIIILWMPIILLLIGALLIIIGKYAPFLYWVAAAGVALKIRSRINASKKD